MDKREKAREFCKEVKKLAEKYDLSFFVVTEGASCISNKGCEAVKVARENHVKWELSHGHNPYEDWEKEEEEK